MKNLKDLKYSDMFQHDDHGLIFIQGSVGNGMASVLKRNGESIRVEKKDIEPLNVNTKRLWFMNDMMGVYNSSLSNCDRARICLSFIYMCNDDMKEVMRVAKELELDKALDRMIEDSNKDPFLVNDRWVYDYSEELLTDNQ